MNVATGWTVQPGISPLPDGFDSTPRNLCYNAPIAKKPHNPNPNGRRGNPVSLYPLTPAQALAELLKIKPSDVAKIKAEAAAAEGKRRKK